MLQYGFTGKISEFLQFWQTKNHQQDKKVADYRFFFERNTFKLLPIITQIVYNVLAKWRKIATLSLEHRMFHLLQWNIYQVYRDVIDHARDSLWRGFHRIPLTPLRYWPFVIYQLTQFLCIMINELPKYIIWMHYKPNDLNCLCFECFFIDFSELSYSTIPEFRQEAITPKMCST